MDAQNQLNIISDESSRDQSIINPSKTKALLTNIEPIYLEYDNNQVPISGAPKHLGVHLSAHPVEAEIPISKSRKTTYALIGAGTHGRDGVNCFERLIMEVVVSEVVIRYEFRRFSR